MPRRPDDPAALFAAARDGDRGALARLLSMVERGGDDAREVGRLSYPLGGTATTVGITGAPGAGKSTLTSALVRDMRADGETVAVLAVDPSSPFTGGAILGDRVRMGEHALDDDVFIRSMATRGHLGGLVARRARGRAAARRRRPARGCCSRPWAWARSRSRSPARPTRPWWW